MICETIIPKPENATPVFTSESHRKSGFATGYYIADNLYYFAEESHGNRSKIGGNFSCTQIENYQYADWSTFIPKTYEISCNVSSKYDVISLIKTPLKVNQTAIFQCGTGMRFIENKRKNMSLKCKLESKDDAYAEIYPKLENGLCEKIYCPIFESEFFHAEASIQSSYTENGTIRYRCERNFKFPDSYAVANNIFQSFCVPYDDSDLNRTLI